MKFDDMFDFDAYIHSNNFKLESSNYIPEGSESIIIKNNQFHESEEYYLKDNKVYRVKNMETASKTKVWEDNFQQLVQEVRSIHSDIKLEQLSFYLNQFLNEKETLNNIIKYIDKSMNK
jgi:hypothetical protein